MKERNELARAMTELPDELLLEAEQTVHTRKPIKFRRLVAAAAVIAMLAVTVGAAAVGMNWKTEQEEHAPWDPSLTYYADEGADGIYYKLEYTMPLEPAALGKEARQNVSDILAEQWKQQYQTDYMRMFSPKAGQEFLYDSRNIDLYREQCMELRDLQDPLKPSYTSLAEIEELLDITLAVPEKLRQELERESKFPDSAGLQVQIHTGLTNSQARELWGQGTVEPCSIEISYELRNYCSNGEIYGGITIPLTQKTADEGLQCQWYSYEKEGEIWHEEQMLSGYAMHLFGNDPQKGYEGYTQAVYAEDGIGYRIGARCFRWDMSGYYPNSGYENAKDMLLSLLTDEG